MNKLTVEKYTVLATGRNMVPMRIGGFAEGELEKLKSMPNDQAKNEILDMLDQRNNNMGSVWQCGYGVYGLWFDNEYAYMNIGTSCD